MDIFIIYYYYHTTISQISQTIENQELTYYLDRKSFHNFPVFSAAVDFIGFGFILTAEKEEEKTTNTGEIS